MEVHEVLQFVTTVVPMGVTMASDWAIGEVFGGVCCANGCFEVPTDDGGGIFWAFSHDFI
jgi:hypothetical protein